MSASLIELPAPKKVLIADDDAGLVRFLADRCKRLGFDVETAANGLQAIIIAGRFHPDVVILDINMPEIDGLSVAARLLAPDRPSLEVIVITASAFSDTQDRCQAFGAIHIRKGPELMEGLRSALLDLFPSLVTAAAQSALSAAAPETWTLPRLLIVDDNPQLGELLTSRLLKRGIKTVLASDGVHGHSLACRHEPSLIMAKHSMRNGNAYYLLHKLRSTPKNKTVPVIIYGNGIDETEIAKYNQFETGHRRLLTFLPAPVEIDGIFVEIQKTCAFSFAALMDGREGFHERRSPPTASANQMDLFAIRSAKP